MGSGIVRLSLVGLMAMGAFSCSKSGSASVSTPVTTVGQTVKPGNISGTIKGTLQSDSSYYVTGDVSINKGDTLVVQAGVHVYFTGNYSFFIHGNLLSLGTKDKQVWFTVQNLPKSDVVGQDPLTDNAYKGSWGGLLGDTTTKFMILKWTHVEFGGGRVVSSPVFGITNNNPAFMISFVNQNGIFVMEDSWIYGGVDDPIRVQGGKIHIFRNTMEKGGSNSGEGIVSIKSGTQGNVGYNMNIGSATNGFKASNNGGRTQTNVVCYNNTIINGGYRRFLLGGAGNSLGRGGSIDYEEGASGIAYNNLLVDCKFGLRVVGTASYLGNSLIIADTAHLFYGYNFNYGDHDSITSQFYPTSFLTKPEPTDIPAPAYLPAGYTLGSHYDGTSLVGKNNPMFVNYPLPKTYTAATPDVLLETISFVAGYDFHLQTGSPAIGKGTTAFTPLSVVPIDPVYGATELTPPGADMGCYQSNGSGNKH